jgi:hypothetical protein
VPDVWLYPSLLVVTIQLITGDAYIMALKTGKKDNEEKEAQCEREKKRLFLTEVQNLPVCANARSGKFPECYWVKLCFLFC